MATTDDLDQLIEQFHLAQDELVKGNAEPAPRLISHRGDVTLGNPLGPFVKGWEQVAKSSQQAAAGSWGGSMVAFETIAK